VPETHLEIGRLYLSLQNDPLFAIYHFRQYLTLEPEGKLATMALQMIETATKEFSRSLPLGDDYGESPEYLNLMEVLEQVRKKNAQLKKQIVQLTVQAKLRMIAPEPPIMAPVASHKPVSTTSTAENLYVVQTSDTLSKISLKVYGTTQGW
jgi:nucleoid-associated protein YgaU